MKIPRSVLVLIHTDALQVLMMERVQPAGFWQSVTGSLSHQGETWLECAIREVREETSIDCSPVDLLDWNLEHQFEIHPRWASRYASGVKHNTEHVFSLVVPLHQAIRLNPSEHLRWQWLPWSMAADLTFSWTNALAIRQLPERIGFKV